MDVKPGGIFYDVGSGSGRGIFAACVLHEWKKAQGIELLSGLYTVSNEVLNYYNQHMRYENSTANTKPKEKKKQDDQELPFYYDAVEISFVNADLRKYDWSDGDVIFANSTCFDEKLMEDLSACCERLKKGTYVISLTKKIKSDHFQCLESKQYHMSWGYATVHTQIKIKDSILSSALSPPSIVSSLPTTNLHSHSHSNSNTDSTNINNKEADNTHVNSISSTNPDDQQKETEKVSLKNNEESS